MPSYIILRVGLLIDSLMVTMSEKYMALIWVSTGVIMIFSGVYYPVDVLPPGIRESAMIMPSTHAITSLRTAVMGGSAGVVMSEMLIGMVLGVAVFLIGSLTFRFAVNKGRENGVLTKY